MDKPTASVDIIPPISGDEPTLNMNVLTTAGFSIQGEITQETAKALSHALWLAFTEIGLRARVAEELANTEVRRLAHLRHDYHVNPSRVLCAHDHCSDTCSRQGDTHPWDVAIADGWKPLWDDTDLICADCAGPKEDCPWKAEVYS